jgi:uncharacterized repeat protein (TIGR01451 family)
MVSAVGTIVLPDLACRDQRNPDQQVESLPIDFSGEKQEMSQPEDSPMTVTRGYKLLWASCFVLCWMVAQTLAQEADAGTANANDFQEKENFQLQRMEYFHQQRAFPYKTIPRGAFLRAQRKLDDMIAKQIATQSDVVIGFNPWQLIGADPDAGFWGNNSGRVSAIAVDPLNSMIAYLGAADGGIWKTTDGGTSWTPLTDRQLSMATGAIAIGTTCSLKICHEVLYVGTGEQDFSGDSYSGAGILRSTDGGNTWTNIPGPFVGSYIGSLAVSPSNANIVLAGVEFGGVYRSADGGNTWTQVLAGTAGTKVLFDPAGSTAYAAMGYIFGASENGVYKSIDAGVTWAADNGTCSRVFCFKLPLANAGRITLVLAKSSPSTLFAALQDASSATFGASLGVYKTTDGGVHWSKTAAPSDFCANCWYNLVMAVSPNDANVVFGGGSGKLYRSLDGGATWGDVTKGLHPDHHALQFDSSGATLYEGNDGGVWKTTDPTGSSSWTNLNGTLATLQYYTGISINRSNPKIAFGGTQDNSTERYTGALLWQSVTCGDGGYTAIDFSNSNIVYADCQQIAVQKSTSGGAVNTWLSAETGIDTTDRVLWIPPLIMDSANSLNLYFGTYRVYQTTNGAGTWTAISPDLTVGGDISTLAVDPRDTNVVWSGSSDGQVYVTTNANAGVSAVWTNQSTGLPVRYVSRLVGDPHGVCKLTCTPLTTYATFAGFGSGHVFRTQNNGSTWTDISGDLPDVPVNDLVVDPTLGNTLYVATDIGVFQTRNGGTNWTALGIGTGGLTIPRSVVLALALHNGSRTLRAATHGRSMWDLHLSLADLVMAMTESPNPVKVGANLTYTITVTNNGPDPAAAVTATDAVPGGTTFQSVSTTVGSCTAPPVGGTGTVKCSAGTLAKSAGFTVTLVVKDTAASGSTISNTAKANSGTPDPKPGNNSKTLNTAVN